MSNKVKFPVMLVIALVLLLWIGGFLGGCLNQGQHLGNFKNDCAKQNGVLVQKAPNDYECTLPDGKVLKSK